MAQGMLQMKDPKMKSELKRFRDIAGESYGPLGRLSLLHSFAGGAMTCTNRSGKMLQLLKTTNPVIKLILTSLELHSQRYKDAGLYAALLTANLIIRGLELPHPQYKVAVATGYALSLVSEWLERGECPGKRKLSLSSTEELMALVKTFLASKMTLYGLTNAQLDHVSSLLLQGFLRVAPSRSVESFSFGECLHVLSISGHPVHQSLLLGGVVLPLTKEDSNLNAVRRASNGLVLVALFEISLAGDLEDYPEGLSLEAESNSGLRDTTLDDTIVTKLMGMASHIITLGVGLVGCQKCVHPQVKDFLRENGVCVVERLSSLHIGPVKSVSGAELVSSVSDVTQCQLGRLKELRSLTKLGETYLQLEGVSDEHCSLIVTSHLKRTSEELASLCNDAVTILEQTLSSPFILPGGGCMETLTAHHLRQKANENASTDVLSDLQCNQRTLSAVMLSVAESFAAVATWMEHDRGTMAVDSTFHHCWSLPPISEATPTPREDQSCRCGAVTSSTLPAGSKWTTAANGESLVIGEVIEQREAAGFPGSPGVCDCYTTKLRAIELTGDIASTVLQTACIVSLSDVH